ncbi:MAG: LysM peptidoglycan-binding domain-containing protein [Kiritimatiellae bacterium]|nr:LysM peptidoglycan-binding domain-containing protein [Kiritimatiellia bacterium]
MEDYSAGRIGAAVTGFEKALRRNPANASARFQLGCLLQESKRDYIGAYCAYREYLAQRPDSDKVKLARDRLAICEKEVARRLAAKYGLNSAETVAKELEAVRGDLKSAKNRIAATEKNLSVSLARTRSLTTERDRLLAIVKGEATAEEKKSGTPPVREVKDLLEEAEDGENGAAAPGELSEEANALLAEDDVGAANKPSADEVKSLKAEVETGDRVKLADDVAKLKAEESDEVSPGSSLLPTNRTSVAKKKPDGARPKAPQIARPKAYEVKEGDTLYGIAKRFYGTLSAWKMIREANKALISPDNRLRAGDKLVLP